MKEFFTGEGIDAYALCPFRATPLRLERKLEPLRRAWGKDPQWVVVFLAPYYVDNEEGNLSLYARSRDYHLYFEGVLERLKAYCLQTGHPGRLAAFSDNSPFDEVELAARCGLGVKGDHGLLIHPRYGSFVFIGTVLWEEKPDLPVSEVGEPGECSHCGACQRACPVGKNMASCLSALTQKKHLTQEEEELLQAHSLVWGCDTCQLACPHNRGVENTPLAFFREERIPVLTREILSYLQESGDFEKRAFAWRGIQVLMRNLSLTL